jgi:hypothetical protein
MDEKPSRADLENLRTLLVMAERQATAAPGLQLFALDLYPIRGRVDLALRVLDKPTPQVPTPAPSRAPAPTMADARFPPLESVTLAAVDTAAAAYYLNRKEQTLRGWACNEDGPLRPLRVHGRLAWPVEAIKQLLQLAPSKSLRR